MMDLSRPCAAAVITSGLAAKSAWKAVSLSGTEGVHQEAVIILRPLAEDVGEGEPTFVPIHDVDRDPRPFILRALQLIGRRVVFVGLARSSSALFRCSAAARV